MKGFRFYVSISINTLLCILNVFIFLRNISENHLLDLQDDNSPCAEHLIGSQNANGSTHTVALLHQNLADEPIPIPIISKQLTVSSNIMSDRLGAWWFWKKVAPMAMEEMEPPEVLRARLQPGRGRRPGSGPRYPYLSKDCPEYLDANPSYLAGKPGNATAKIAMCLTVRNGGRYLQEWVAYHVMMGVTKIQIYDDRSTDNPRQILKKWVDAGVVEFRNHSRGVEGTIHTQISFLKSCARYFWATKRQTGIQWVANIDVDEFLVPRKWKPGQLIGDLLPTDVISHEAPICIQVGRVQYGSGYHLLVPPGLVTESYTLRSPKAFERKYNKLPKILLNIWYFDVRFLKKVLRNMGIHGTNLKEKDCRPWSKNEYGTPGNMHDGLRVNHYLSSAADWIVKVTTHRIGTDKFLGGFNMFLPKDFDAVYDDNALPYVCQLKQEMGLLDQYRT